MSCLPAPWQRSTSSTAEREVKVFFLLFAWLFDDYCLNIFVYITSDFKCTTTFQFAVFLHVSL